VVVVCALRASSKGTSDDGGRSLLSESGGVIHSQEVQCTIEFLTRGALESFLESPLDVQQLTLHRYNVDQLDGNKKWVNFEQK